MANDTIEIGSITFLVNVPTHDTPSDEEMDDLGTAVANRFAVLLRESPLSKEIAIQRVEFRRGCVLAEIYLVATAAGASVAGVALFLEKYPKIRAGAIQLAKDMNSFQVKLGRWAHAHRSWFFRDDFIDPEEIESRSGKQGYSEKKKKLPK